MFSFLKYLGQKCHKIAIFLKKSQKRFGKINIEISNICNLQCSFCPEVIREKKMMTIVKMGTNPSGFRLSGGKFIILNVFPAVNDLEDGDFELLMKEYGHFIKERTYSDKNLTGCFVIHEKRDYASEAAEENGGENKDGSAPIEVPVPIEAAEGNKGKRKGKEK